MKIIIFILAILAIAKCADIGTVTLRPMNLQADFHYEDPFKASHKTSACNGSKEKPLQWEGLDKYWACMPTKIGDENKCYQDYPPGTTATPMPIYVDEDEKIRCALVCSGAATGNCGPRAECMILPGIAQAQVGVCMYKER